MGTLGRIAFFSHRSGNGQHQDDAEQMTNYELCCKVKETLQADGSIHDAIIVPPKSVLPEGALLTACDCIELMTYLYDALQQCDVFLKVDKDDWAGSYWTLLEQELWRYHAKTTIPLAYTVRLAPDEQGFWISQEAEELEPLTSNSRTLWARLKVYIKPEPMTAGHFWGRYSRNCLIVGCRAPTCRRSFLISQKAVENLIASERDVLCPFCRNTQFRFEVRKGRWPWRVDISLADKKMQPVPPLPLGPDIMIGLLLDDAKRKPDGFPLFCCVNESFPTDAMQVVNFVSGIALVKKVLGNTQDVELRQ